MLGSKTLPRRKEVRELGAGVSHWQRLSSLFSVSLLMGLCKHGRPLAPLSLDSALPLLTYSPNYRPEASERALIFIEGRGSAWWAGELVPSV